MLLQDRTLCRMPPRPLQNDQDFEPNRRDSLPIVRPVPGKRIPPIRTQARSAVILPNFVGLKFHVYNGKVYNEVNVTEQMVGHKLGEFSPYDVSSDRVPISILTSL